MSEAGRTLADVMTAADERLRSGERFSSRTWATGFEPLDTYVAGGLRAGELTLLGGPQGLGKTTFALQIARNVVAAGGEAVYLCYEHTEQDLLERLLTMEAAEIGGSEGITLARLRTELSEHEGTAGLAERLGGVGHGAQAVESLQGFAERLTLVSGAGIDLAAVEALAAQAGARGAVLFVDYLQKIGVNGVALHEDERVSRVVETLKDLALAHAIPVVAIVAADIDGLRERRTRLHHLRGSSALAYEADVALMLNDKFAVVARHHLVYDAPNADRFRDYLVISIEKNRGGLDNIDLQFRKDFEHGRYDPTGTAVSEQLIDDRIYVE